VGELVILGPDTPHSPAANLNELVANLERGPTKATTRRSVAPGGCAATSSTAASTRPSYRATRAAVAVPGSPRRHRRRHQWRVPAADSGPSGLVVSRAGGRAAGGALG
jgi:hypothetical protein